MPLSSRGELADAVIAAVEREHQRVASELHDGICQELAGIAFSLDALVPHVGAEISETVRKQTAHLRRIIADTRRLALGLTPLAIDRMGLQGALVLLQQQIEESNLCTVSLDVDEAISRQLPREERGHLYRIAQEAIANAVRHGKASRVLVSLTAQQQRIVFAIEDDGSGIDASAGGGIGLHSMRARTEWLGARLSITARLPRGTRVEASMKSQAR